MLIEKIALWLTQGNEEQAEIYRYVLKSKLHTWGTLGITFFISYLLGILPYALIVTYSVMLLRINSGGCHSKTLTRCSITSFFVINVLALMVSLLIMSSKYLLIYYLILTIIAVYHITKYAPMDSPQRPIVNKDFRNQLKDRSYIALIILINCFFFLNILGYQNLSIAVLLGLSWQVFTMSKLGYWTITKVDNLI